MHSNLIALLMTLDFLLCLAACWLVRDATISEREEMMRIQEAHRNIQWPVSH